MKTSAYCSGCFSGLTTTQHVGHPQPAFQVAYQALCWLPQAMEEVWGEGEHVQCVHPVSLCVAGRENVRPLQRTLLAACWVV